MITTAPAATPLADAARQVVLADQRIGFCHFSLNPQGLHAAADAIVEAMKDGEPTATLPLDAAFDTVITIAQLVAPDVADRLHDASDLHEFGRAAEALT